MKLKLCHGCLLLADVKESHAAVRATSGDHVRLRGMSIDGVESQRRLVCYHDARRLLRRLAYVPHAELTGAVARADLICAEPSDAGDCAAVGLRC